ncbi:hypothetical protein NC652_001636 [Populus alba x Populus x berolinensis]|nr:hypothetical protein NC652_001636 [Populus alba x Populus x berolinensis]
MEDSALLLLHLLKPKRPSPNLFIGELLIQHSLLLTFKDKYTGGISNYASYGSHFVMYLAKMQDVWYRKPQVLPDGTPCNHADDTCQKHTKFNACGHIS